jgi:hypothetical protein
MNKEYLTPLNAMAECIIGSSNDKQSLKQKTRHNVSGFFMSLAYGIRPFLALVPFLIVCKERNEKCYASQTESVCLN